MLVICQVDAKLFLPPFRPTAFAAFIKQLVLATLLSYSDFFFFNYIILNIRFVFLDVKEPFLKHDSTPEDWILILFCVLRTCITDKNLSRLHRIVIVNIALFFTPLKKYLKIDCEGRTQKYNIFGKIKVM